MKYSYLLLSFILASPIKDNSEKYILSQFEEKVTISLRTLTLNKAIKTQVQNQAKQAFYKDKLYYWEISKNDTTMAYAFLDNVKGKSMPITFIVIMNINGTIKNSSIIKYREAYGGEIKNKRWLKQFIGKKNDSTYEIGQEIDSITGATISVNSISKGIRKIAILYELVKDNLD